MSEFWSALAGAILGGVTTFFATWWQTKRVLSHEREMAQAAGRLQREAVRQEIDSDAARELFAPLADLERVVSLLSLPGAGAKGTYGLEQAHATSNHLRDLQHSTVSLISRSEVRDAWAQLRTLVSELASARTYTSSGIAAFSDGWTQQNAARAGYDVEAFIRYVRAHLLAVVDNATPPAPVENPPVLRRQDMSVWQPPGAQYAM
jgi:hypothetical protein